MIITVIITHQVNLHKTYESLTYNRTIHTWTINQKKLNFMKFPQLKFNLCITQHYSLHTSPAIQSFTSISVLQAWAERDAANALLATRKKIWLTSSCLSTHHSIMASLLRGLFCITSPSLYSEKHLHSGVCFTAWPLAWIYITSTEESCTHWTPSVFYHYIQVIIIIIISGRHAAPAQQRLWRQPSIWVCPPSPPQPLSCQSVTFIFHLLPPLNVLIFPNLRVKEVEQGQFKIIKWVQDAVPRRDSRR